MAKRNKTKKAIHKNKGAESAIQFLEDLRVISSGVDEPTQMVSIRIPANILRAVKLQAKFEGKKYQSLIVQYIRQNLSK